ncbi:hypothetical protein [Dactylosporangium sp. CA-139066]|uniref:hypothetical protein n=1 Tax=Dactylosporangium sp. CA-139066 TaxID=3239930 RepID=UPI003D942103
MSHSHGDFSRTVYETLYVTPKLQICDDRGRLHVAGYVPAWDDVIREMQRYLSREGLIAAWEADHGGRGARDRSWLWRDRREAGSVPLIGRPPCG